MNPEDLLIDADGDGVTTRVLEFLGVQREAFVCPECNVACDPTTTYDAHTAAFDGGESPAWECPECGRAFVREVDDEQHTVDLYGRE